MAMAQKYGCSLFELLGITEGDLSARVPRVLLKNIPSGNRGAL